MLVTTLFILAASATQRARTTLEFTIDPANTNLELSGAVLREDLSCTRQVVGSQDLGDLQVCPSGDPSIPFNPTGPLKLTLFRDPAGMYQASLAGGRLQVADFAGFVGDCGAPTAEFAVSGFVASMASGPFPVNPPGSPVAGCSVGDNFSASSRMLVLTGHADITASGIMRSFELDCSNSAFTPTCGSVRRQGGDLVLVVTYGIASPLVIPWSYEVDLFGFCPPVFVSPFRYVRFSGNLNVSGTLTARLTRVIKGPPGDANPGCP